MKRLGLATALALGWICGTGWAAEAEKIGSMPSILVLTRDGGMDAKYEADLTNASFRVTKASLTARLSLDYLKQFGAVILTDVPFAGEEYEVRGHLLADVPANMSLIDEYITGGGGVLLENGATGFGEFYSIAYNKLFGRYGLTFYPQGLRDDAELVTVTDDKKNPDFENVNGIYARGLIVGDHPIVKDLKYLLYPTPVLRWDMGYGTAPFTATKDWTILATGKATSGTHEPIDNHDVGPRLSDNQTILAIRPVGKGLLMASAIHNFYTLTQAYCESGHQGEMETGFIKGYALNGLSTNAPSDLGKLFSNAYRYLAANSAKNGLGNGSVALPEQAPKEDLPRVTDWRTQTLPPTWQHKVRPVWRGEFCYYDEMLDPTVAGEMKYFKALVGARSAVSSGKGSVKDYRAAAEKAGYSAIYFTETLEDLNKSKWTQFVKDCETNSDATFACVPGYDLGDAQGQRYLILGIHRFPDPSSLTEDGKKLKKLQMLSLGWGGILTSVHRPNSGKLHPKMWKHFQGVTVYTYDGAGKLVDDAFLSYQWQTLSDGTPFPITAHEVTEPGQVATAAASGFQQILPAPTLSQAVDYFHYGLSHNFDNPPRYFISEGPILDAWSIWNKDIGYALDERDHFRVGIGVSGTEPISEVVLTDGLDLAGRWTPNATNFSVPVDGFHNMQHEFLVQVKDAKGRRALSPPIRTVSANWRLRCGDKQNWLGTLTIYTGNRSPFVTYRLPAMNTVEGLAGWSWSNPSNISHMLDFPFYSQHVQVDDLDLTAKYINAKWEDVGADSRSPFAVQPTAHVDGYARTVCFKPRASSFATALAEVSIRTKKDVVPEIKGPLYPVMFQFPDKRRKIILPGAAPTTVDAIKEPLDLPVGSYVGGVVILSPGLRLVGREIGFPTSSVPASLPAGTNYTARYVFLRELPFAWRNLSEGGLYGKGFTTNMDNQAEAALSAMGFRGTPPFTFNLKQGTMDKLAFTAEFTARDGGVAGACVNAKGMALLDNVPCVITGLNPRVPCVVWRSDAPRLEYFALFPSNTTVMYKGRPDGSWQAQVSRDDPFDTAQGWPFAVKPGTGMGSFNADKTVDFYAGNVAACDPALFVSVVIWNKKEAWFRVNNPTDKDITTEIVTPAAIKGFKRLKKTITVKAGVSLDVEA